MNFCWYLLTPVSKLIIFWRRRKNWNIFLKCSPSIWAVLLVTHGESANSFIQGWLKCAAKDNICGISLHWKEWEWFPGSSKICRSWVTFFFTKKNTKTNKHTTYWCFKPSYWPNTSAEPFNGLKTACHQLLQTQRVLSFPTLFCPLCRWFEKRQVLD